MSANDRSSKIPAPAIPSRPKSKPWQSQSAETVLKTGTTETARRSAFTALVFAELLRAFGGRSETKPVWRILLFTNVKLVIVVAISVGLQVWSQHNATFGRFLKTSHVPLTDCFWFLSPASIPL